MDKILIKMEENYIIDDTQRLLKKMMYSYYTYIQENFSDLTTWRTTKLLIVTGVMKELGLNWMTINQLFRTHTPIHPEISKMFMGMVEEDMEPLLAQIFVRNDKLIRILKYLYQHYPNMDQTLAVDGLNGNMTNGPNFDYKNYIGNLIIGFDSEVSEFDENPEYRRKHVRAVRQIYNKLKDSVKEPSKHIYLILRKIILDLTQITLPSCGQVSDSLREELFDHCENFYLSMMTEEDIKELVKNLRRRGEKRSSDDEDNKSKISKVVTDATV